MSKPAKLKPCPFCGGSVESWQVVVLAQALFRVRCLCGAIGPAGETSAETKRLWNRRAATVAEGELDSPNSVPKQLAEFAARDYQRQNRRAKGAK